MGVISYPNSVVSVFVPEVLSPPPILSFQSPMFDGKVPHWHHYSCFWKRAQLLSHADLDGFSELRWEDQEKIKKHIESGGAAAGKLLTDDKKRKGCQVNH